MSWQDIFEINRDLLIASGVDEEEAIEGAKEIANNEMICDCNDKLFE